MNTETPRTDAVAKSKFIDLVGDVEFVPAIICRQLERELSAMTENYTNTRSRIDQLERDLLEAKSVPFAWRGTVEAKEAAEKELAQWRKVADELGEGLRRTILWAECCQIDRSKYPDGINWNYLNDGRKALAAYEKLKGQQ